MSTHTDNAALHQSRRERRANEDRERNAILALLQAVFGKDAHKLILSEKPGAQRDVWGNPRVNYYHHYRLSAWGAGKNLALRASLWKSGETTTVVDISFHREGILPWEISVEQARKTLSL